jgi:hypothetical protein
MDAGKIKSALTDVTAEQDPTIKSLKMASLCSALWAERGVELVVVGGSAIEILTEGAYASGDLDMCHATNASLPMRERQEIMGLLGAKGGPRNWQVAGMFVDVLGPVESFARTPFRRVRAPYGDVLLMKPEDLLVERVLVSVYPGENPTARGCAKKLAAMILDGSIPVDWTEVRRVANLPEYRNIAECVKLVEEVADELKIKSPLHSD